MASNYYPWRSYFSSFIILAEPRVSHCIIQPAHRWPITVCVRALQWDQVYVCVPVITIVRLPSRVPAPCGSQGGDTLIMRSLFLHLAPPSLHHPGSFSFTSVPPRILSFSFFQYVHIRIYIIQPFCVLLALFHYILSFFFLILLTHLVYSSSLNQFVLPFILHSPSFSLTGTSCNFFFTPIFHSPSFYIHSTFPSFPLLVYCFSPCTPSVLSIITAFHPPPCVLLSSLCAFLQHSLPRHTRTPFLFFYTDSPRVLLLFFLLRCLPSSSLLSSLSPVGSRGVA